MNIYNKIICNLLFTTPELKREYELEVETKAIRIHGLHKSVKLWQGYKDIERLYPEDSTRIKRDFTFAIIKFVAFGIILIGSTVWYRISQGINIPSINFNMDLTQLPIEVILIALAVMSLNVLDSLTTKFLFRLYPDKELKGEGNPIMRSLMLKNFKLAEAIKQTGCLALVLYCLMADKMGVLKIILITLGLVVLNNAYLLISRAITKRKVQSPTESLRKILHIPSKYMYFIDMAIIIGLSVAIQGFLWS